MLLLRYDLLITLLLHVAIVMVVVLGLLMVAVQHRRIGTAVHHSDAESVVSWKRATCVVACRWRSNQLLFAVLNLLLLHHLRALEHLLEVYLLLRLILLLLPVGFQLMKLLLIGLLLSLLLLGEDGSTVVVEGRRALNPHLLLFLLLVIQLPVYKPNNEALLVFRFY